MKKTDHTRLSSAWRQREILALAALGLLALTLAWALVTTSPAMAGPLHQDSPLAPQEQLSPLPTAAPTVEPASVQPTPTAAPALESETTAESAAKPAIPLAALVGVMAVIGLVALIIGLRRK